MTSAVEAKVGMIHMNGKPVMHVKNTLDEMDHPQRPTTIKTNNNTAEIFLNKTVQKKKSKGLKIKFYWIIGHIEQKIFECAGREEIIAWLIILLNIIHQDTVN